jgi:hypothetical protein
MRILQRKWIETGSSTSRLQFERDSMLRYLLIDGKRAYSLGIGCQTCGLLFERLSGANQAVEVANTAEKLREGICSLDEKVVESIGLGLPEGEFCVLLAEAPVRQVRPGDSQDYFVNEQIALWGEDNFWCLPHDPRVPYYRAGDHDLGKRRRLFNFVVPMFPTKWLTMTTVSKYMETLRTKGSGTALSLAVLDVKSPADWDGNHESGPVEHWCLTHYLVDGHHKLHAASESEKPLRLLSFLALSGGVSTREDVEEAVGSMLVAV